MVAERVINEVQGLVAAANERGVKLVNGDGWINFSKFAPAVTPPPMGAMVVLGLDKAGYIREVSVSPEAQRPRQDAPEAAPAGPVDRDARIMRQAVLNTAVNILCTNGMVDVDEVLQVAARLESWVLR